MIRRFTYPTAEEANAFCDGVEFANGNMVGKVWLEYYGYDYIACVEEEGEEEDQTMQKIVINGCHGGYSLSRAAIAEYLRRKGLAVYPEELTYSTVWWLVPPEERTLWWEVAPEDRMALGYRPAPHKSIYKTDHTLTWDGNIERDDPVLVSVVEDMGDAASGEYAELKVVEIPDGVEWRIEEYDGWEWVAEEHRTWG